MVAIIAAVLFGLALLFQLLGVSLAFITPTFLLLAGFICVALHLAGVGGGGVGGPVYVRGHTRSRPSRWSFGRRS
jgi:hypothetical protein